jgi:hypothetical protein
MVDEQKRWSNDFIFLMVLLAISLVCMGVPLPFFMADYPEVGWWDVFFLPCILLAFPCSVLLVQQCYGRDEPTRKARSKKAERTERDTFLAERRKRQLRHYALLVGITVSSGVIGMILTRCENGALCFHFGWPIITCAFSASIVVLLSSRREIVDRWEGLENAWHAKRKVTILETVSRWKKASGMPIGNEVAFKPSA